METDGEKNARLIATLALREGGPMSEDYEYHQNKNPEKTYVSKSLSFSNQPDRRFRIASKVIDSAETTLRTGERRTRYSRNRRRKTRDRC